MQKLLRCFIWYLFYFFSPSCIPSLFHIPSPVSSLFFPVSRSFSLLLASPSACCNHMNRNHFPFPTSLTLALSVQHSSSYFLSVTHYSRLYGPNTIFGTTIFYVTLAHPDLLIERTHHCTTIKSTICTKLSPSIALRVGIEGKTMMLEIPVCTHWSFETVD